jgi:hypothetical protein
VEPGRPQLLRRGAPGPHVDLHQRLPLPVVRRRRPVELRSGRPLVAGLGDQRPRPGAPVRVSAVRRQRGPRRRDRLHPLGRCRLRRDRLGVGQPRRPRLLHRGPAQGPGDRPGPLRHAVRADPVRGRIDPGQRHVLGSRLRVLVHAQRLPLPEHARRPSGRRRDAGHQRGQRHQLRHGRPVRHRVARGHLRRDRQPDGDHPHEPPRRLPHGRPAGRVPRHRADDQRAGTDRRHHRRRLLGALVHGQGQPRRARQLRAGNASSTSPTRPTRSRSAGSASRPARPTRAASRTSSPATRPAPTGTTA